MKDLSPLLKSVEKRFDNGRFSDWKNRDYQELSFQVKEASKILISPGTLKRVFGKLGTPEGYKPQVATIKALEAYVRDIIPEGKNAHKKQIISVVIIMVCLFVAGLVLLIGSRRKKNSLITTHIELLNIVGYNHSTAVFKYILPDKVEGAFVDFGDGDEPVLISAGEKTITHYYRHPGAFEVSVFKGEKAISAPLRVFVETDGWSAMGFYFDQGYSMRHFKIPLQSASFNGMYFPDMQILAKSGLDTTKICLTRIDNYKETDVNGDNFSFETRFKSAGLWSAIRCNTVLARVQGSEGEVEFTFSKKECSHWGHYRLSEKYFSGEAHDLSGISFNTDEFNSLKFENKAKNVSVYINNSLLFNGRYENSIGNIMGVSLLFHGSGYLDYLRLRSGGKILFQNEFE